EHAITLLQTTDQPVNEIALQVGIDNANYFSILFKKLTGKTPKLVRDEKKKQDHNKRTLKSDNLR
ncbi:MAG: helix-turn-helix domain-containing protein, partial [Eubacterium sp.]|nr:helix-turn-helix domain-containing protein [Eubacterium sp.]